MSLAAGPTVLSPPQLLARVLVTIAVVGVGYWLLRHVTDFLGRSRVRAGAATPPAFDLPPAVVCLLVHGAADASHAAAATALDLAARGRLTFDQPGADPATTTVAIGRDRGDAALTPYEEKVFDRVQDLIWAAAPNRAALSDLARLHRDDLADWNDRVEDDVIADARARGLVTDASGRGLWVVVLGLLLACTLGPSLAISLLGLVIPDAQLSSWWGEAAFLALSAVLVLVLAAGVFALSGQRRRRCRPTRAGRRAASYWLGVRRYLRGQAGFDALPPAAVAVWGRNLAYGSALGVTRYASAAVGLGGRRAPELGSAYGGEFRVVRVRYPGRLAASPTGLRLGAVVGVAGLVGLGGHWWSTTSAGSGWAGAVLATAGGLAAAGAAFVGVRTVADRLVPARSTGLVLSRTELRGGPGGRGPAYLVVVDPGQVGEVTAWLADRRVGAACRPGQVVHVRGGSWSRRIVDSAEAVLTAPGTITATRDLHSSGHPRPKGVS